MLPIKDRRFLILTVVAVCFQALWDFSQKAAVPCGKQASGLLELSAPRHHPLALDGGGESPSFIRERTLSETSIGDK